VILEKSRSVPHRIGWILQVALWIAGAAALLLAVAIDSGFEHIGRNIRYTTPVLLRDIEEMLRAARAWETVYKFFFSLVPGVSFLITTIILFDGKRRIRDGWRLGLLIPQFVLLGLFGFYGLVSLFSDLPKLYRGGLDGEWLHEGWHFFEAVAIWSVTPFLLTLQSSGRLVSFLYLRRAR
jgi:hypothetical protein